VIKTIYIIDQDAANRERLKSLFISHYNNVKTYGCTESFLAQRALSSHPALLIMDVDRQQINALELLRYLDEHHIPIPVILLGHNTAMPFAVRAIRAGAQDFIEKPFLDSALQVSVRRASETETII